jgi:valyl-tRNA synthetase
MIDNESQIPKGCGVASIGSSKIFLELGSHIDGSKELARLNKKLEEIAKFKENLEKKIKDKNRDKKPEKVRQEEDEQMAKFLAEEATLLQGVEKIKQFL